MVVVMDAFAAGCGSLANASTLMKTTTKTQNTTLNNNYGDITTTFSSFQHHNSSGSHSVHTGSAIVPEFLRRVVVCDQTLPDFLDAHARAPAAPAPLLFLARWRWWPGAFDLFACQLFGTLGDCLCGFC